MTGEELAKEAVNIGVARARRVVRRAFLDAQGCRDTQYLDGLQAAIRAIDQESWSVRNGEAACAENHAHAG